MRNRDPEGQTVRKIHKQESGVDEKKKSCCTRLEPNQNPLNTQIMQRIVALEMDSRKCKNKVSSDKSVTTDRGGGNMKNDSCSKWSVGIKSRVGLACDS